MEISQVKTAKYELAQKIKEAIKAYELDTDTTVEGVYLDRVAFLGSNKPELRDVRVNVTI